jgi:hypothetical protein
MLRIVLVAVFRDMMTLKMLGPRPLSNYGILIFSLKAPAGLATEP